MNIKFSNLPLHDILISDNMPLKHRIGTKTYIPVDMKGNFQEVR